MPLGPDFGNQSGNAMQVDRGSLISGPSDNLAHLSGPPGLPYGVSGSMGAANQALRPPAVIILNYCLVCINSSAQSIDVLFLVLAVNTRDGESSASTGHEPHTRADKSAASRAKKSSAAATADVASLMQFAP